MLVVHFLPVHHYLKHDHPRFVPGEVYHPLVPGSALHMDQLAPGDTTGERVDDVWANTGLLTFLS